MLSGRLSRPSPSTLPVLSSAVAVEARDTPKRRWPEAPGVGLSTEGRTMKRRLPVAPAEGMSVLKPSPCVQKRGAQRCGWSGGRAVHAFPGLGLFGWCLVTGRSGGVPWAGVDESVSGPWSPHRIVSAKSQLPPSLLCLWWSWY